MTQNKQIVELVACGAICAFNDDVEICKNSSCQIPLKLTNTGLSHTVYELFPSNTFCDSNGTGHDHDNCEYEGLGSTDKTTVPFTKQETSTQQTNLHTNEKGWSSDIGSIADEQLEPLAYDSNVVSETVRTLRTKTF
ncbi:hypothetical protein DPMN_011374 [Dreissena polymorpha]|uniref:Uncharacterized protein n=1 Tax=Dreissena polymorpha TaxID=45954 RepID=A0A9D4N0G0_DREPO|nr:hypothetical protein DPMN_011374 [Dreissena polymorpha]